MLWWLTALLAALLAPALAGPPAAFAPWASTQRIVPHPEPDYHFAAEVWSEIAAIHAQTPGVVNPFFLGLSVEKRPIWAFGVRDPATPVTRRLLLIANIHAMEWVPTEDALAFLISYAERPIPGTEVVIVPILNPDGREKVEADLLAGRNLYRRGNEANVDLNRDWAVHRESSAVWKALLPARYVTSEGALSQPETRLIDTLLRYPGDVPFSGFVSLHSFGGFIYYPWAGRFERTADWRAHHALATEMSAAMGPHAYRPRQLARWGFFFRGLGMEVDHVYGEFGIPSFLVETTRSGIARPSDLNTYFRWYNPREVSRHVRAGVRMLWAWAIAQSR